MIRLARRAFVYTLLGLLVLSPRAARSQVPDASCGAVERTEAMRNEGQFRAARALLLECVNAQCDGDVRRRCATALQKLDALTPSIVVRASDPAGDDLTDVAVGLAGGERLVSSLDGMAIPVDPGEHTFTFERAGQPPVSQTINIAQGEKFRPIDVVVGVPERAAPEAEPPAQPAASGSFERAVATGTLIGVGAIGLASFAWLGTRARSGEKDLESCEPACSDGAVESVQKRYLYANLSLGVGVAAIGAATWLLLTAPSAAAEPSEDQGLSIGADGRGAFAAYSGRF